MGVYRNCSKSTKLKLEYFITKRIAFSQKNSFSAFIIKIAVVAVALSVAVMIVTTATVNGFQNEISRKIFGFWGHIHISSYETGRSYDDLEPVSLEQKFYPHLDTIPGIRHIQVFAHKAGIIKTDTDIEGIILKGISSDFDWGFFHEYLTEGEPFIVSDTAKSNNIVISQTTANRLRLKLGDKMTIYIIKNNTPLARRLKISGIYNTGLAEYDEKYALIDIQHIQRINKWKKDEVGCFEVFLDDVNELEKFSDMVYYQIVGQDLYSQNIKEENPNIFEWLELQDMNEQVIITLMIVVAIINMITALLILILERTNMIGILKALGSNNWSVRKIFLYNAAFIIGLGLLAGNIIGLGICLLQQKFGFIRLPEESYYINVAPVDISWWLILALNLGTMLVCLIAMLVPSYLVSHIDPIKAIRFK